MSRRCLLISMHILWLLTTNIAIAVLVQSLKSTVCVGELEPWPQLSIRTWTVCCLKRRLDPWIRWESLLKRSAPRLFLPAGLASIRRPSSNIEKKINIERFLTTALIWTASDYTKFGHGINSNTPRKHHVLCTGPSFGPK